MFYLQQMHPIMLFDASIFPFFVRVVFTMQFQKNARRLLYVRMNGWQQRDDKLYAMLSPCFTTPENEKIPMSQEP